MDTLTLVLTHEVLTSRSIRHAARTMRRPPSTVSSALSRLEAEIALPLIRRENGSLILTVEAERRLPSIATTVRHVHDLFAAVRWRGSRAPSLSIDSLLRFSIIAHVGSIRSAARSLSIGQPQLARQMADMERRLNCTLLIRSSNGTELTETGHRVLASANAIVSGWQEISQAASNRFRRDIRTWHIGTVIPLGHDSGLSGMLADLVVEWDSQQAHPLRITSDTADELLAGLKARRYDVVVLDHHHVPADFDSAIISSTPLVLVGRKNIMKAGADVHALLHRHPLVLPSRKSGIRQEAMRFMETLLGPGVSERIGILEIDSIPVIINLVVRHGYLSVLPRASVLRLALPLAHVDLPPGFLQRLVMVWRKNGMPKALIDAIHRISARMGAAEDT